MFNGIYSYVFGETKEEVIVDKKTLDNRHHLLKEIISFKTDLLKSHTPPKKKKKLYKYRRKKRKPHEISIPSDTGGKD